MFTAKAKLVFDGSIALVMDGFLKIGRREEKDGYMDCRGESGDHRGFGNFRLPVASIG